MQKVVILDNIRSAHNVGSVFRTADGAGVQKIFLVGTTPAPLDRFGREQPEIKKTSLGATGSVAWEQVGESSSLSTSAAVDTLTELKRDGFTVVAIEQTAQSISLTNFTPPEKIAYIFGAEVDGVQTAILEQADQMVEIPMQGMKESLNVSVAAGIVLFHQ